MKGLSVLIALLLLFAADRLATHLKRIGALPAERSSLIESPALGPTFYVEAPPPGRETSEWE